MVSVANDASFGMEEADDDDCGAKGVRGVQWLLYMTESGFEIFECGIRRWRWSDVFSCFYEKC